MKDSVFEIMYAGHALRYSFRDVNTRWEFRSLARRSSAETWDIRATKEQLERTRTVLPEDSRDAFVEYRALIGLTARELLKYDCCIFHGVSFVWKGAAFLLTAPSGVGKSTQFFNWQRMFPGEIAMICGDMPTLERREDGSVWAHPSPWNGKERLGDRRLCGPVAGIVLLEQGSENSISPLSPHDAITPFFGQFLVRPETEEEIRALARLMDQTLRNVPLYKLVNLGDDASTALLRETLSPLAEGGSP